MAAEPPPQDLTTALHQIQSLKRQLSARDDRIGILERENCELRERATWLLDWSIQQHGDELQEAISEASPSRVQSSPVPVAKALSPLAHAALSTEVTRKCCFRFMDLPAEIRNRIYDLAAHEAFSVPCMLVYPPSSATSLRTNGGRLDIIKEQNRHRSRLADAMGSRNRLGLPQTSRQIHHEARQIYFEKISFDLRCIYHPAALEPLLNLIASPLRNKLQFVRHIEVDADVAHWLFFPEHSYYNSGDIFQAWKEEFATHELTFTSMARLRTLFFNIEATTIFRGQHHFMDIHEQSIGLEILFSLIGLTGHARGFLERLYPRLSDIITMNDFGAERLRKIGPEQWELYYSHERLPTTLGEDAKWYDTRHMREVCDEETGLIHSRTLANLAH